MSLTLPTSVLTSIAASRLSMNIRSITVERGIATLARQSQLPRLLSRRGSQNPENVDAREMDISSESMNAPTSIQAAQAELEGGYYDDEDSDVWCEEQDEDQDEDQDEEIQQEDRGVIRSTSANDVETGPSAMDMSVSDGRHATN